MDARIRKLLDAALGGALLGASACAEDNPRFVTIPVVTGPVATSVTSAEPMPTSTAPRRRPSPVVSAQEEDDPEDDFGKHACKGQNSCKGQGGCKTMQGACKGQNNCKGQGGCKTP